MAGKKQIIGTGPPPQTTAAPKRKGRLMKVVTSKKSSKKHAKIYERNATESPLLRLPPEIRNRIFRYVLAGKIVHIRSRYMHGTEPYARICADQCAKSQFAKTVKADTAALRFKRFGQTHAPCREKLQLDMLLTCRQVHDEAALLPFSDNLLSFQGCDYNTGLEVVLAFPKVLAREQARAIRDIILVHTDLGTRMFTKSREEAFLADNFTGLESITFIAEFEGEYETEWFANGGPTGLRYEKYQSAPLRAFRGLPLKEVTVVACNVMPRLETRASGTTQPQYQYASVPSKLLREWESRLEEEMMAGKDEEQSDGGDVLT